MSLTTDVYVDIDAELGLHAKWTVSLVTMSPPTQPVQPIPPLPCCVTRTWVASEDDTVVSAVAVWRDGAPAGHAWFRPPDPIQLNRGDTLIVHLTLHISP